MSLLPKAIRESSRPILAGLAAIALLAALLIVALFQAEEANAIARLSAFATFAGAMLAFVATLLIVALTARNVEATAELVVEARDARLAQSRPQVLVSFERNDDLLELVIGHYGGGPAQNVRFHFAPKLTNEDDEDIGSDPPFSTGIPLIVPGYRQRVRFGNFDEYRTRWFLGVQPDGIKRTPGKFAATVKLSDPLANNVDYTNTFVLDLEHLFEFNQAEWQVITCEDIASVLLA